MILQDSQVLEEDLQVRILLVISLNKYIKIPLIRRDFCSCHVEVWDILLWFSWAGFLVPRNDGDPKWWSSIALCYIPVMSKYETSCSDYPNLSERSSHFGFIVSISSIFLSRRISLIIFSLSIAHIELSPDSKYTSFIQLYFAVNDFEFSFSLCSHILRIKLLVIPV